MGTKFYLILSFLNDLKDSERDMGSLTIIQRVAGWPLTAKSLETLQNFINWWPMIINQSHK